MLKSVPFTFFICACRLHNRALLRHPRLQTPLKHLPLRARSRSMHANERHPPIGLWLLSSLSVCGRRRFHQHHRRTRLQPRACAAARQPPSAEQQARRPCELPPPQRKAARVGPSWRLHACGSGWRTPECWGLRHRLGPAACEGASRWPPAAPAAGGGRRRSCWRSPPDGGARTAPEAGRAAAARRARHRARSLLAS